MNAKDIAATFDAWIRDQGPLAIKAMAIASTPKELTVEQVGELMALAFAAGFMAARELGTNRLLADLPINEVH